MSGVPPKHPKKKPRLDASPEPQPGPSSSGGADWTVKKCLKRSKENNSYSQVKRRYHTDPASPGFLKTSEILKAAHSSSSSSSSASWCSSSSEEEEGEMKRRYKYRKEMPLSSSLKQSLLQHFGSVRCPRYIKTLEALKRLHEYEPVIISSSSTEDEESVQATRSSEFAHEEMPIAFSSKPSFSSNNLSPGFIEASETAEVPASSFLRQIEEDSVSGQCGVSNTNAPSGSKCDSEANNCKKLKCEVDNIKRETNATCTCSKITKHLQVSESRESALEEMKDAKQPLLKLGKKIAMDSLMKPQVCGNLGWDKKNEVLLETITDNELFFKRYRDRYGLVENSMEEDTGVDYFSNLPTHIIELILCTVPILDFMSCRQVCKRWMGIIDNQRYMKWKKIYYKYKKNHHREERYEIIQPLAIRSRDSVDGCVATLVNYMGKQFNRVHSKDMYDCLLQNPHGELADHVLTERFPEWNGKDSRVWCQLAIAVLICETVWDILKLYKTLVAIQSNCLRTDIHDAFYCFALFLFLFRCWDNINCGLHYRIYYALYVIENSIPLCQRGRVQRIQSIPGQQSIENNGESEEVTLTSEQIRILHHHFEMRQRVKIMALAGSGKTTTLVHLARLYPQIKFLNIVFNKSVNREARKKFPSNVVCKTAHGIAFEAVGREFQHKLTAVIRPYDLIPHICCNEDNLQIYLYARLVLAALHYYMHSKDPEISLHHVPRLDHDERPVSPINRERILIDAGNIWLKMRNCTSDVRITHDVYLKLYQLKKPNLDQFQCIMVDEAQDCDPTILDIVLSQRIPVILVGDPHQQIYNFRGTKNAFKMSKATHTYYLTKSFRFGPEISYMASCVLEVSLNFKDNVLVGNTMDSNLRGETSGQFAVIARTNIVLFNEAVRMIALKRLKPYEPQYILPFFAGGLASYGFDQMLDIYMLKYVPKGERKMMDKFINRFKTLHDLNNYAKFSDDADLKAKIDLVNQHGHELPNYLVLLKKQCNASMQSATVIFSTAHKSKGLEFDTVSLTDDYVISPITGAQSREEANILYVAITRAKKCLLLPEKVTKVLHAAHEKFEYPVSSRSLLSDNVELKCVQCDSVFLPHTVLTLVRRKILMGSGRDVTEGPLCMKCRSDPTMRPDLHLNGLIMYLDPVPDNSHRFMNSLVGPLPTDPPIVHDRFTEFGNADRVFVINLNIH